MVEHTDLELWHHDFRSKLSKILTKAYSIRRIKEERCYSELTYVADGLCILFDEITAMGNEMFIELKRLTKEE